MASSLPRKGVDATVRQNLTESAGSVQQQAHGFFDRVPLLREIPDRGFVLATVGGTVYIYSRVGSDRYKVAMTLV